MVRVAKGWHPSSSDDTDMFVFLSVCVFVCILCVYLLQVPVSMGVEQDMFVWSIYWVGSVNLCSDQSEPEVMIFS